MRKNTRSTVRMWRALPSALAPAALLVASLLSLQSRVGDAAVGGLSSAELLQSSAASAAMRPAVHRLRGGELGGGTHVVSPQGSPALSSTRLSPRYSSETLGSARRGHSTVHFESSQLKDQSQQDQASPLPEHLKALKKQLEQQKVKDFVSPTNLRTTSPREGDLDLSTPIQVFAPFRLSLTPPLSIFLSPSFLLAFLLLHSPLPFFPPVVPLNLTSVPMRDLGRRHHGGHQPRLRLARQGRGHSLQNSS